MLAGSSPGVICCSVLGKTSLRTAGIGTRFVGCCILGLARFFALGLTRFFALGFARFLAAGFTGFTFLV